MCLFIVLNYYLERVFIEFFCPHAHCSHALMYCNVVKMINLYSLIELMGYLWQSIEIMP